MIWSWFRGVRVFLDPEISMRIFLAAIFGLPFIFGCIIRAFWAQKWSKWFAIVVLALPAIGLGWVLLEGANHERNNTCGIDACYMNSMQGAIYTFVDFLLFGFGLVCVALARSVFKR